MKFCPIVLFLVISSLSPAATDEPKIPSSEDAVFSVYLKLPEWNESFEAAGRPGPGFEIYDVSPHLSYATVAIFPKNGEPFMKRYENARCPHLWESLVKIDLLKYKNSDFGDEKGIEGIGTDDEAGGPGIKEGDRFYSQKTMFGDPTILIVEDKRSEKSLKIYDPLVCIDALKGTAAGKDLKDFYDLYFYTIGYYTLIDE